MDLTEKTQKIAIHEIVGIFVLQEGNRLDFRPPPIPAGKKRPAEQGFVAPIPLPRDCLSRGSHRFPAGKLEGRSGASEIVAILHGDVDELFRGDPSISCHQHCRQMQHGPAGMPVGQNRGTLRDGGDIALGEKARENRHLRGKP